MWLGGIDKHLTGPYTAFLSPVAYRAALKELGSHEAIESWYMEQYGVDVTVKVTQPMSTKR